LLGHAAGNTNEYVGLAATQVTRLSLDWAYRDATPKPTIKTNSSGVVEQSCPENEAQIYYSLERKMPNILYDSPIVVSYTTPLWVQAIAIGKTKSDLVTTCVGTSIFQPSLERPASSGQGLRLSWQGPGFEKLCL